MDVKYPEVTVKLSGRDGNAFAIIGRIEKALRREVDAEAAAKYVEEAMTSDSYDALLRHAMRTVNVV